MEGSTKYISIMKNLFGLQTYNIGANLVQSIDDIIAKNKQLTKSQGTVKQMSKDLLSSLPAHIKLMICLLASRIARITSVAIRGIATAIKFVNKAILSNPIVLTIAAIIAAVFYLLYKYVKPVRELFNKIVEWITSIFSGLLDWVAKLWGKFVKLIEKAKNWLFPKGGMYAELAKEKTKLDELDKSIKEFQEKANIKPTMDLSNMDAATAILTKRYAELGLFKDSKPIEFTNVPLKVDHSLSAKPQEINIKVESTGTVAIQTERGAVYSPLGVATVSSTRGY